MSRRNRHAAAAYSLFGTPQTKKFRRHAFFFSPSPGKRRCDRYYGSRTRANKSRRRPGSAPCSRTPTTRDHHHTPSSNHVFLCGRRVHHRTVRVAPPPSPDDEYPAAYREERYKGATDDVQITCCPTRQFLNDLLNDPATRTTCSNETWLISATSFRQSIQSISMPTMRAERQLALLRRARYRSVRVREEEAAQKAWLQRQFESEEEDEQSTEGVRLDNIALDNIKSAYWQWTAQTNLRRLEAARRRMDLAKEGRDKAYKILWPRRDAQSRRRAMGRGAQENREIRQQRPETRQKRRRPTPPRPPTQSSSSCS